ncbi:cupin domain-containing protein [Paraburkholderia hospita]|uniref:cupin domain-containing protein n=1 Tax=Paraburkholderia hospita TaxID=169430 RepID=UPI000DEED489|nr:cupin domain-containing protein [Paraburkholderia hospita]AXF05869.1 cupin domain-containing protein [Paraburkholderia hospita]
METIMDRDDSQNSNTEGYRPVRRIITDTNAEGKSYFLSDASAPNRTARPGLPVAHVLWATGEARAAGADPAPAGHAFEFHSRGGSLLRIVDFPPDETYDETQLKEFLDANGVRDKGAPRHFWFHKTESLDYAFVLEGEIWALLDEGEKLMRAGDVLIQRATNHSWANRSGKPCRMAFVLLDLVEGEPL